MHIFIFYTINSTFIFFYNYGNQFPICPFLHFGNLLVYLFDIKDIKFKFGKFEKINRMSTGKKNTPC